MTYNNLLRSDLYSWHDKLLRLGSDLISDRFWL